jgi:hypothetical protein
MARFFQMPGGNMNSLEARLIELNEALLKLASGQKPDINMLEQAQKALAGSQKFINTGPGNDTVIINKTGTCEPGAVGATGPEGPPGATGPAGPPGATGAAGECAGICCTTRVVSESYQATISDCYIGVDSTGPTTITLPSDCETGCTITVKSQMGPPGGNRKITIVTADGATIDGADDYVIEVPYQNITVICVDGDWWII